MEIPQLNPIPQCPQRCQDGFAMLNTSLRKAGEALSSYEAGAAERQETIDFRDKMVAEGKRHPTAEVRMERALAIGEAAALGATSYLAQIEAPIKAINNMPPCALGGCKYDKGNPLLGAALDK